MLSTNYLDKIVIGPASQRQSTDKLIIISNFRTIETIIKELAVVPSVAWDF
jgi:hypothetical protein